MDLQDNPCLMLCRVTAVNPAFILELLKVFPQLIHPTNKNTFIGLKKSVWGGVKHKIKTSPCVFRKSSFGPECGQLFTESVMRLSVSIPLFRSAPTSQWKTVTTAGSHSKECVSCMKNRFGGGTLRRQAVALRAAFQPPGQSESSHLRQIEDLERDWASQLHRQELLHQLS